MNILFLAYASEPGAGSEYGVGWMVPQTMAKKCPSDNIYVLTRSRCREKIEKALEELALPNLRFLFYDIPSWLFYKDEMKSNWGEQINYLWWQLMSRGTTRNIVKQYNIDVVHHLTFNQYRTPSPGFWTDVPFVMGPIGGAETIAESFEQDLTPHTSKKETIRRKGRDLKVFGWFMRRRKNKKLILCSCAENLKRLSRYAYGHEMKVMPAIAYSVDDFAHIECQTEENPDINDFVMLYAGKAWDWKGIRIFLRSVKKAFLDKGRTDFQVKLVGIRFEEEQKLVMEWVTELGLENHVKLIPFIQRAELLSMMRQVNLSVYPAFRDSGSMSVLEASALACPTICFDAGGQDIFPDKILLKVPVGETYDDNLSAFAEKLDWAYTHQEEAKSIGAASKKWVEDNLTWEKKVAEFRDLYMQMTVKA